jgi:hypothetical protein
MEHNIVDFVVLCETPWVNGRYTTMNIVDFCVLCEAPWVNGRYTTMNIVDFFVLCETPWVNGRYTTMNIVVYLPFTHGVSHRTTKSTMLCSISKTVVLLPFITVIVGVRPARSYDIHFILIAITFVIYILLLYNTCRDSLYKIL